MENDQKKGKNVRLYILESDEPRLKDLCNETGLTITDALTKIVSAGLQALETNHYRVTLPLTFVVSEKEKPFRQRQPSSATLNEKNR